MTLPLTRPVLKGSEIPGTFPNLGPPYSFLLKNFSYLEFSLVFFFFFSLFTLIKPLSHLSFFPPTPGPFSSLLESVIPQMYTISSHFTLNTYPHSWVFSCMLLLLSHFSRVRLCATPQTSVHQAPPSLGLSRQEHWSSWDCPGKNTGLPFPSPMHESEKWRWSRSV